ncbi:MAG: class F sortase [Actinomycetota bacterium]|jgi:hypothetical protein|nr:class F sortase [Acidothermales bacterium]MDQ3431008.1 class F sortase [Actinomycetota bacterium]
MSEGDDRPMAGRGRGARTASTALAVVLGLTGTGLITAWVLAQDPAPPAPSAVQGESAAAGEQRAVPEVPAATATATGRPTATTKPTVTPREPEFRGPTMTSSPPVRVTIPATDVSATMVELGLNPNGTMTVPEDPAQVGWYTKAPTPGSPGPAILAGHVTWNQVPTVFFKLGELGRGDEIRVERADGSTAVFEVTSVEQYAKEDFPTDKVYGAIDFAGLRLITCGGVFDGEDNRYLDNVVAYAKLVESIPA